MSDRTIDGHLVEVGLVVWNYDLEPAVVAGVAHVAADGTTWYSTWRPDGGRGKDFDASRMWHWHPSTRERAPVEVFEVRGCEEDEDRNGCNGACITRPHRWRYGNERQFSSPVCQRSGCNVMGTGDRCGDGQCLGED